MTDILNTLVDDPEFLEYAEVWQMAIKPAT